MQEVEGIAMVLGLPVLLTHRGLHDVDGVADHVGGAFRTLGS
ncbi:MAG: hypothetical protein ACXWLD_01760 [Rhizomicrobium sp.]